MPGRRKKTPQGKPSRYPVCGDAQLLASGGLRSPAGDAEVTRLLREWDTATARLRALGVAIPDRPGAVTMAEWADRADGNGKALQGRAWRKAMRYYPTASSSSASS